MQAFKTTFIAVVFALGVAACGGGGGNPAPATQPAPAGSGSGGAPAGASTHSPNLGVPGSGAGNTTPTGPSSGGNGSSGASGSGSDGSTTPGGTSNNVPATQWSVTNLGTLPGDTRDSVATAINNNGDIVGWSSSETSVARHPFLVADGSLTALLPDRPDQSYEPKFVTPARTVVGYTWDPRLRDPGRGFILANGAVTIMGTALDVYAVDDAGRAVGEQSTWDILDGRPVNGRRFAVLYDRGNITDLTARLGVLTANGINNAGQIVGQNGDRKAYLYSGGRLTNLGTLPGDTSSAARAINTSGAVVGTSYANLDTNGTVSLRPRAFLYTNGSMTDLNAAGGFVSSTARAINNAGEVLLQVPVNNRDVSWLYADGRFVNLSALPELAAAGWSEVVISAMNDRGRFVGYGIIGGKLRALLLVRSGG